MRSHIYKQGWAYTSGPSGQTAYCGKDFYNLWMPPYIGSFKKFCRLCLRFYLRSGRPLIIGPIDLSYAKEITK